MKRIVFAAASLCLVTYALPVLAIPAGNYDRSCRNIRESRDGMSAVCRDNSGRWVRTSVRFSSCRDRIYIQNHNGRLVCSIW